MKIFLTTVCLLVPTLGVAAVPPAPGAASFGLGAASFGPGAPLAVDDEVVEVSLYELMNAKYVPGKPLPDDIQELDGKKVKISGYMALGTLEGVDKFELVSDSCECGRSKVNHFVEVTLTDDVTRFNPTLMTLEGTFSVGEVEEDGFVTSLYRLTIDKLPQ